MVRARGCRDRFTMLLLWALVGSVDGFWLGGALEGGADALIVLELFCTGWNGKDLSVNVLWGGWTGKVRG